MSGCEGRPEWVIPVTPSGDFDVAALQVDDATRAHIATIPQGSPEWLQQRYGRLTSSRWGAIGNSAAEEQLLRDMVWPEDADLTGFARTFAAYGTAHEPVARNVYIHHRALVACDGLAGMTYPGLLVDKEHGFLGGSPDFVFAEKRRQEDANKAAAGITSDLRYMIDANDIARALVTDVDALPEATSAAVSASASADDMVVACGEIKCPYTQALYSSSGLHEDTDGLPAMYLAQITAVMGMNGYPFCDTVVYTPHVTEVRRFYLNQKWYDTVLKPSVVEFYMTQVVPRVNARLRGVLTRGHIHVLMHLPRLRDVFGSGWVWPEEDDGDEDAAGDDRHVAYDDDDVGALLVQEHTGAPHSTRRRIRVMPGNA